MTYQDEPEACADLDRLLADTRTGNGGCLILRGEPAAADTSLLEYAVDRAGDMRRVRASGAASESDFRFGAVHQVLAPFLARLNHIPSPQRQALRSVVGLAHGASPDRFLVGLALLSLLSDAARDQPLLITIDDGQWFDQTSAEVLAFVARRLRGQPIAMVMAIRAPGPGSAPFAGLPARYLADQPDGRRSAVAVVPQPRGVIGPAPRSMLGVDVQAPERTDCTRPGGRGVPLRLLGGPGDRRCSPAQAAGPARAGADPAGTLVNRLRDGIEVRLTEGYPAAVPLLRPVVNEFLAEPGSMNPESFAMACTAAGDLLDDGAQYAIASQWVRTERKRGDAGSLPEALSTLARLEADAGRLADAETRLAEACEVAAADRRPSTTTAVRLGELTVQAWRGRDEQATSPPGLRPADAGAGVLNALAVLDLASGRYPAALARSLDLRHRDAPEYGTRILPDLIEAASRTGDRAAGSAALDRLAERATATGTPLALGLLARSRALLTDGPAADRLYREARAHLEPTSQVVQLARTLLLHGEWLRRRRRQRDAREHLGAAADMFAAMEMSAFAQRTRMELRATGERAGRGAGDLTPQESQITRLVADGLTNREIATQLFISSNTVEYHLQKVFRKIGVTSRSQLTRAVLTANPAVA